MKLQALTWQLPQKETQAVFAKRQPTYHLLGMLENGLGLDQLKSESPAVSMWQHSGVFPCLNHPQNCYLLNKLDF